MNKTDSFVDLLSQYKYVSFDVFDTLLYRTFPHYTDVFDMMEALYNEAYDEKLSGFKKARINAERIARREKDGKEVTLDLIYEKLIYKECLKNKLKEIEKKVEIENCVPNQVMIDVLNECRSQGKRIVITTDMYLPRDVIDKILRKLEVEYDYLFISGEEGITKRSGELFPIVLQKLGINATDMIHIGDDTNNDILQPHKYGIAALERIQNGYLPLPYSLNKSSKNIENNHIEEFLKRGVQNYGTTPEVILGYTMIGPLLWEFCEWIHNVKKELQLDRLHFVAREGWLIMQCYNLMYPEDGDIVNYIRLNKNLLRLPSLTSLNCVEKFLRSIPTRKIMKWRDILSYLGVSDDDTMFISKIQERYKFT